jgi:MFS family permease
MTSTRCCCPNNYFYGWTVVASAGMACICSFPGNTFGIAFFLPHLQREIGLTHIEIASIWGGGVLLVACLLPFVGKIVDYQGPWRIIAAASVPLSLATMLMSWVNAWWQLLILIGMMRFFGIGLIYVASVRATNHWFVKKRGRVSVLLIICFYGTMALPSIISWLITKNGWRSTYRILACSVFIGMCGTLIFLRNDPTKYGLLPDGEVAVVDTTTNVSHVSEVVQVAALAEEMKNVESMEVKVTIVKQRQEIIAFGIREATKKLIFWILTINIFIVELYWCACQFNMLFLLGPESKRAKLGESQVVIIMVVLSIVSGIGSIFAGLIIEIVRRRRDLYNVPHRKGLMILVSAQMFITCASAFVVPHIKFMEIAVVWAVLFSFMIGIQGN